MIVNCIRVYIVFPRFLVGTTAGRGALLSLARHDRGARQGYRHYYSFYWGFQITFLNIFALRSIFCLFTFLENAREIQLMYFSQEK